MSFKINAGLFKYDFSDHHAILGVPLDANTDDIRKRYKQIARRLHPDSCKAESDQEKHLASQLFSKLVSPAYTQLSKDKSRAEHNVILGRMGQRLLQDAAKLQPESEAAKQLMQAGGDINLAYRSAVQKLAETQYETISKVLEAIGTMSELNTIYLLRKERKGESVRPAPTATPSTPPATRTPAAAGARPAPGTTAQSRPTAPPSAAPASSPVEPYCRRAEELMEKSQFAKAEIELRDALKMEPSNSRCHGLLGMAYLKQNKAAMAKVHINQALKLNPQDPAALEGKKILDKLAQSSAAPAGKQNPAKPNDKPGGGGLFGMFGKKK